MTYPNSNIKNSSIVSDTYLEILISMLSVLPGVKRDIHNDVDLAKGEKFGSSVQKKKPTKAKTFTGRTYSSQTPIEDTVTITFDGALGTGPEFDVDELTMQIPELQKALEPYARQHASDLESWFCDNWLGVNGEVLPGSNSGTIQWKDFLKASALLTLNTADSTGKRSAVFDPITKVNALDKMLETQGGQDAATLSKIFKDGAIAYAAGYDWRECTRLPLITTPADVVGTVSVNYTEGSTYMTLTGLTDGQVWQKGTPITIGTLTNILPDTRKDSGRLKQIILKADATVGAVGPAGAGTQPATTTVLYITIDPLYYTASDARQNISAQPTATTAIALPSGLAASKTYRQAVCFDQRAFGFYSVEMANLPGVVNRASTMDGISVKYTAGSDISDLTSIHRYDSLSAGACFYPEWVVRVWEENI